MDASYDDAQFDYGSASAAYADQARNAEARTWGPLVHLSSLSLFMGIPFGNVLGPLVIWLWKREQHPWIDWQAKQALNFQITLSLVILAAIPLCILLIGFPLLIAALGTILILPVVAAVKTANRESYHYPFAFPFIK